MNESGRSWLTLEWRVNLTAGEFINLEERLEAVINDYLTERGLGRLDQGKHGHDHADGELPHMHGTCRPPAHLDGPGTGGNMGE